MKNESKQNKELILLSAYLDNELPIVKRQSLEKRLLNEPELRRKLDDLHKTKMVIGNLTRVKAPRNFTLSEDMIKVRRKKQSPWFSTLKLATSLAAILLVVLFSFEIILQRGILAGDRGILETGSQTESFKTLEEGTPQPLILWSEPGIGGGEESPKMEMAEDSNLAAEAPQVESDRSPEESEINQGLIEEEMLEEPPVTDDLSPPSEEQITAMEEESKTESDGDLILGLNPDAGGEIISQSEPGTTTTRESQTVLDVLNTLQIGLALFIFIGGVILWIFRSKQIF